MKRSDQEREYLGSGKTTREDGKEIRAMYCSEIIHIDGLLNVFNELRPLRFVHLIKGLEGG